MALFLQKLYVIGIKRDRKTSRLPGLTKLFFSYYVCITGILPFLFFILHFYHLRLILNLQLGGVVEVAKSLYNA